MDTAPKVRRQDSRPARNGAPQLRKHTKNFTGCWSCRARRVRCDEGKPQCRRCLKRQVTCEGYGVRLQWVGVDHPDEFEDTNDKESAILAPRRNIEPDKNIAIFSTGRVGQILTTLDTVHLRHPSLEQDNTSLSCFIDYFGVFSVEGPTNNTTTPLEEVVALGSPVPITTAAASSTSADANEGTRASQPARGSEDSREGSLQLGHWQPTPWPALELESEPRDRIDPTSIDMMSDLEQIPGFYDNSFMFDLGVYNEHQAGNEHEHQHEIENAPQQLIHSPSSSTSNFVNYWIPRSPSSPLSADENLLLQYYSERVLYIFSVIDHEKSPWKTVHLPKALQAAGEYGIKGSTTKIRGALVSTILAISAFLLSNDNQYPFQTVQHSAWRSAAAKYRLQAIEDLRHSVESHFLAKSRLKYKEHLATALSMITMNVISGEMNTCGIHLDGCLRLIRQAQKWKCNYSPKAKALHRIYFYLRIIHESTAPPQSRKNREHPSEFTGSSESYPKITASPTEDIFCRDILQAQMIGFTAGIDMDLGPSITNCEQIYGIPHGLLMLLTKVIDLIDKFDSVQEVESDAALMDECDELEKTIMDWPVLVGLEDCAAATASMSARIVHQHTLAFHNALIIYFAQSIRPVSHRLLQPYVEKVLESMETIERLKEGTQVLAAPLYWPGFIAASETHNASLQRRFRRWYSAMQVYGIEALRTGMTVIEEVWRIGPSPGPPKICLWRQVVQGTGVRLMLS